MYTYNLVCYGHELSLDPVLNNLLRELDLEISTKINNKKWEIDFPYHGGQCMGDVYSCVFGTIITDDDNPNLIDEIRNLKEEDYAYDYDTFLEFVFNEIENLMETETEFIEVFNRLNEFIHNNKPNFYQVEVSS